jgi:hypothetical protein
MSEQPQDETIGALKTVRTFEDGPMPTWPATHLSDHGRAGFADLVWAGRSAGRRPT